MFWKNYKTMIPAIIGIIPVFTNAAGIHIPENVIIDIEGAALFFVGLLAKDFDK